MEYRIKRFSAESDKQREEAKKEKKRKKPLSDRVLS